MIKYAVIELYPIESSYTDDIGIQILTARFQDVVSAEQWRSEYLKDYNITDNTIIQNIQVIQYAT